MTLNDFKQSLSGDSPAMPLSDLLKAMWYDGKENWDMAHSIVQDINSNEASWIHAYLHRKEGDIGNASYWYHKAGRSLPNISLQQEWEEIVRAFL
ncbi:MAG TPA: hypothetical protein VFW11_07705 [Cyclobacteriaceae bacterium]|nr:hypothetical protein [Cyclobacteriaceae bacterium]